MTGEIGRAFKAAFHCTIPIFVSFWFLGFTYGIYMHALGFPFWYPMIMSFIIFGGSLEFVAAGMMLGRFAPLDILAVALMIQSRHLFYGIAMLDKFKGIGFAKKAYLIFGLCDETFSINYTAKIPQKVNADNFMLAVTILNHLYWFTGSTVGGLLGAAVDMGVKGLDFAMTAMFVVIFLEQWLKEKNRYTGIIGILATAVCLWSLGEDKFLVPAMLCILCLITIFRRPIEKADAAR